MNFLKLSHLRLRGGELLREHQGVFTNGNLIYKYLRRCNGCIQRTIISQDEAGRLWSEVTYLGQCGDTGELKFVDVPKRKIIDGILLGDYVATLSEDEKYSFLCRFFDWVFTEYATTDTTKVKGMIWDCHLQNFIMNNDGFHFIDFDLVARHDIPKTHCIYRICDVKQYRRLTAHFGLPDNWQKDEEENKEMDKQLWVNNMLNQELIEHYFSPVVA